MAQPSNRRPINIKSQYFPPKGQYSGLEDQNRLETTSHLKLVTDGASPELTPLTLKAYNTPTTSWANSHELGQLTIRARGTRGGGGRGSPRVSSFAQNSNRTRLKLYVILLLNITQPLIQPLYGCLGPNLGWKRD